MSGRLYVGRSEIKNVLPYKDIYW